VSEKPNLFEFFRTRLVVYGAVLAVAISVSAVFRKNFLENFILISCISANSIFVLIALEENLSKHVTF